MQRADNQRQGSEQLLTLLVHVTLEHGAQRRIDCKELGIEDFRNRLAHHSSLLETLLNQNGATLIERNGVYAVVPLAAGVTHNLVSGANAVGAGTQIVPLRYASARDLAKVLEPYVAEGGKVTPDSARNALVISGDPGVRQTLVGLVRAFDIDDGNPFLAG